MTSKSNKHRKKHAMAQVRTAQKILRRWDPIGIEPGKLFPLDEYDGYAPHIVSLVLQGCSIEQLADHLQTLQKEFLGIESDPKECLAVANEFINALHGDGEAP